MHADWQLVTPPVIEPLSLADAKQYCRTYRADEDALVTDLTVAARQVCEEYLSRGLLTQTYTFVQDAWTAEIWLPRAAPLQSVTQVQYYALDQSLQVLDPSLYIVDTVSEPGRILRKPFAIWPTLQVGRPQAVIVTYVVGWTAAALVPRPIVRGIGILTNHLYGPGRDVVIVGERVFGGAEIPFGISALWDTYKIYWRPPVRLPGTGAEWWGWAGVPT